MKIDLLVTRTDGTVYEYPSLISGTIAAKKIPTTITATFINETIFVP